MHTRHTKTLQWSLPWILAAMLVTGDGLAATFDVSISPPRVERRAKAGKLLRDRITITNFANEAGQYRIKTADWILTQERRVTFNEGGAAFWLLPPLGAYRAPQADSASRRQQVLSLRSPRASEHPGAASQSGQASPRQNHDH